MASLIHGYEYDIFISYRQKDNKYDGWVTGFVDNLKKELEATFKEEISVYFDINPHDGLLDTYDITDSLKDKLRCLIFIPIISRTYCDPKSFAFENEFKRFVNNALSDNIGLKIKLANGNISSRILPVRIHDLDPEDFKLCESVTGSFLRCIDFVYKESGVNRPLLQSDEINKNINKTSYRNQINKTALSIKELITGIKMYSGNDADKQWIREASESSIFKNNQIDNKLRINLRSKKFKYFSGALSLIILLSLFILIILGNPISKILKKSLPEDNRLSIVVLPFQNLTTDSTLHILEGISQELMVSILSKYSQDLIIRQPEYINTLIQNTGISNYASLTPSIGATVSEKMDGEIFIYGSIIKSGQSLRLTVKLIDTKTQEVFKSLFVEDPTGKKNFITLADSISNIVINYILLSKLKKDLNLKQSQALPTSSFEAYRNYQQGRNAFSARDYPRAISYYSKALEIDSGFIAVGLNLAQAYYNYYTITRQPNLLENAKSTCLKFYNKKEEMSERTKLRAERIYSEIFRSVEDVIEVVKQIIALDEKSPGAYYELGYYSTLINDFKTAIPALEKSLEIYDEWGVKPEWVNNYYFLANSYFKTGQLRKNKKLLEKADIDFPGNNRLVLNHIQLALAEKDTAEANKYLKIYVKEQKERKIPDYRITLWITQFYEQAGLNEEAEKVWRDSLRNNPENPSYINSFAYFLIDKDINPQEGIELIDKVLKYSPDNIYFLDTKGWGLYKIGRHAEALGFLEKAKKLTDPSRPDLIKIIDEHINAVRKAIGAGAQKN